MSSEKDKVKNETTREVIERVMKTTITIKAKDGQIKMTENWFWSLIDLAEGLGKIKGRIECLTIINKPH